MELNERHHRRDTRLNRRVVWLEIYLPKREFAHVDCVVVTAGDGGPVSRKVLHARRPRNRLWIDRLADSP